MKLIPTKEALEIISFGLFSIQDTAAGIKASLTDKVEAKAAAGAEQKIEMQKLLDTKAKEEDEALLEAQPKADKTENFGDKIKKSTGGFFKRLMTVVAALLGGWLLDKLPKLIEEITKFMSMAKKVFGHVMDFFKSIMGVAKELGDVVKQFMTDYEKDGIKAAFFKSDELKKEMAELDKAVNGVNGEGGVVDQWNKSWNGIEKAIKDYTSSPDSEKKVLAEAEKRKGNLTLGAEMNWSPILKEVGTLGVDQVGGKPVEGLTDMSIKKVEDLRGDGEGVGKYGLKGLLPLAEAAGLKPSDPFSEKNQDMMAWTMMQARNVTAEIISENPDIAKKNLGVLFPHINQTVENEDGDETKINQVNIDQAFAKFKLVNSKDYKPDNIEAEDNKIESNNNVSVEGLGLKSDTASGISTATSAGISTATNEEVPNLKINQVNEDSTITIKSNLSTITFDGKTFPKGLSGPMETFGGKGGSTYGESEFYQDFIGKTDTNNDITNLNPSKKKKIVTVPINTGGSNTVPAGNGSSSTEEETIIVVDNTLTAVNQINTQFT
tara:strand:- start:1242 stop:2888 length:1647 start_codon:yes stop_codon:yes gene_type:complete